MLHLFDEAKTLTLYNFSRYLIERPADWQPHYQVTGFFPLQIRNASKENVPIKLTAWLQNGEAPVYVGFGSIPVPDPPLLGKIINDVLAATQLRIILCKGWSALPEMQAC